jgi:spore germination protein GerM
MARGQTRLADQMRWRIIAGLICVWLAAVAVAADNEMDEGDAAGLPLYLYFADPNRPYLSAEERPAVAAQDPAAFCRLLVTSLIQGPAAGLGRTIPPDTGVRAVFIDGKTAYVDFSGEISTAHPGGMVGELMTVYSIVNTLVLNIDGVDQVKFLIEGRDADTLAGHIDIRFPLVADMMIIR